MTSQEEARITDFTAGQDILQISAAGFGHGLVAGADPTILTGDHMLASNPGNNGYFILDNTTTGGGTLYWDATGGSGDDAAAVAHLNGVLTLLQSSVHVV
jgi:serralysin